MTDPAPAGDLASLEPLEPLDGGVTEAGGAGMPANDAMLQALRSGLPAPAFNLYCRDKSFYRFLFAGVVMLFGCLLPISAEPARAAYQTMSGGFYTLIAIATVWTWWASISNNRPVGLKWLLFAAFPLIAGLWNMVAFDAEVALQVAKTRGWLPADSMSSLSWKELLGDMFAGLAKRNPEALQRAETFWRLFGPANFFIMLGALIAEVGFISGIVGGAKKNKADQTAKRMAVAERKRK